MKITEGHANNVIIDEIAKRIRDRRIKLNLTQKELAEKSGVSSRTISGIEDGQNYSFLTLIALLKTLNLIDNLNTLIPEPVIEPMRLLKIKTKKPRQRASKTNHNAQVWKWGDEDGK